MNIIGATNQEKVDETKVRAAWFAIFQDFAPKKIEAIVDGLEAHFAKADPKKLLQCDQCRGWSSEDLDECPYCGEGGTVTKEAPPPELDAPEPAAATVESGETHAEPDDTATAIDATKLAEAAAQPAPEAAIVKVERKKKADKKPKDQPTTDAPALVVEAPATLATEKDLDESIARFRVAASNGADSMYAMGSELRRMRDELWQQRTEEGKPKYKSFHQFVKDELGISKDVAYRMMRVVECFSAEQFRQYGAGVLKVLVAAPKEEHKALLEKVDAGATRTEIEKEVAKVREEKGVTVVETETSKKRETAGKPLPPANAGASARKKEAAAITVGLKQESATIPLFARAAKGEEARAARTLADQPWGKLEAMNGVAIYVAVKEKPNGELAVRITVKREDEEKDEETPAAG